MRHRHTCLHDKVVLFNADSGDTRTYYVGCQKTIKHLRQCLDGLTVRWHITWGGYALGVIQEADEADEKQTMELTAVVQPRYIMHQHVPRG